MTSSRAIGTICLLLHEVAYDRHHPTPTKLTRTMSKTTTPPRVFISYSWESDAHKDWVRRFAERLTQNGVNVRLDQWHIVPGQSLTQFMEVEVYASDFVLVVCTKAYCRKALEREGGVGYEQQIITGNIVGGKSREQFIPLVRDGEFAPGPECSIPSQFMGVYAIDMRSGLDMDKATETLLRAVFLQPEYKQPTIGARPTFLDASVAEAVEAETSEQAELEILRLPVMEIDGWHLTSGVASHHQWPETFEIPDEKERRGLQKGDVVKLQFKISVPPCEQLGDVSSERMWVIVERRAGPYYIGNLDNVPVCSDEQDHLHAGDQVIFLPEHVISIYTDEGQEVKIDDDLEATDRKAENAGDSA